MTTNQTAASGGFFSKLVVVLLLALAIGLYLRIVMVDGSDSYAAPANQASVRILEGNEAAPVIERRPLRDLPAPQMDLIMKVFADQQGDQH